MASVANIYHREAIDDVSESDYEVTRASGGYLVPGLVKVKNRFTDFSTQHQTDATAPTARNGSKQAAQQRAGQEQGVGQELHGAGAAVATCRTTDNQLVAAQKDCCYDNAAFKPGHDYEELPSTMNHNQFPFVSNEYLHTSSDEVDSNKVNEQTEPNHRSFRRRHNPLYDSVQCKVPTTTTSAHTMVPSCVLLLLTVLCLLLSTVAVVLAIVSISIAKDNQDISPAASDNHQRLEQLEATVQHLQTQLSDWFLSNNASDNSLFNSTLQLIRSLGDKVDGLLSTASTQHQQISQLNVSNIANTQSVNNLTSAQQTFKNNVTSQLKIVETSLNGRIDNITKITGSQSRPANLSNCIHNSNSTGGPSAFPETSSGALDLSVPGPYQGWIITGALCSTTGGTQAFLKYDSNSPQRYICVCRGAVDATTVSRYCELHYWVCPRTL